MRKSAIALFALSSLLTLLGSCGGGGGGGTNVIPQVIASPGPPNVEPIMVDSGPALLTSRAVNMPYVTIKICINNGSQCQTIDHIEVDTGSSGLRILGSVLQFGLPVVTVGANAIAECTQFADGSSFGPLAVVDMTLPTSQVTVKNLNIQVIGATNYPTVPASCPGIQENTVDSFGANGILGVGPFIQDCGSACAGAGFPSGYYYACPTPSTCTPTAVGTSVQVSNPVNFITTDNNGVIVELPSVASSGASSVAGSLVLGINTRSNNSFGSASVMTASTDLAFVQATYNGKVFDNGALDSGSNAVYFTDSSITLCSQAGGLYCPSSTLNLSATLKGVNNTVLNAPFTVGNAETLLTNNPSATALPGLGGSIPSATSGTNTIQFDLGLPFYFGRNVFTGLEGHTAGGFTGPFYAF
ncbi:MAG: DUF3443 family protein [Proteobacteria bacterium]|nr:DUF3443 family protein [Pseudomonadota bacterium]